MSDSFIVPQDTELDYVLSISNTISINGIDEVLTSPENTYYPLQNGDVINYVASSVIKTASGSVVDTTKITDKTFSVTAQIISNISTSVPQGLVGNYSSNTFTLSGTVYNISYSYYSIIIRYTLSVYDTSSNLIGQNYTDTNITFWTKENDQITFYWDSNWLNSLPVLSSSEGQAYVISQVGKGAYINNSVMISSNQDISNLISYSLNSDSNVPTGQITFNGDVINNPNCYASRPDNISIKSTGSFGGSISSSVEAGYYFFRISASIMINGSIFYATPNSNLDTRSIRFCIVVGDYYEYNYSNDITWKTPYGNLGDIYEGYPSYFSVTASATSGDVIYSLAPYSTLPDGLYVGTDGNICGNVPYVSSNTTISFSIRANVQNIHSDRSFSFTIYPTYGGNKFFNLKIPVYNKQISYIKNIQSLITDNVYRNLDSNYGIVNDYEIYFISGLLKNDDNVGYWDKTLLSTSSLYGVGQNRSVVTKANSSNFMYCFEDKLRNYHKPFTILISGLSTSKMYSLDNEYLCDVIYLTVSDKHSGSPSFVNGLEYMEKSNNMTLFYNNTNNTYFDNRVFTPSIQNCRDDLIITQNRINSPTNMIRPNAKAGVGLAGTSEAMPSWMRNSDGENEALGYVSAIVIAYVNSGYGDSYVKSILQSSEYNNIVGKSWLVDRYIFESKIEPAPTNTDISSSNQGITIFDMQYYYSKSSTHFDKETTDFDSDDTLFDEIAGFNQSYVFFPKEIINDIEY